MSKDDPPAKALRKLDAVHRNLAQAGAWDVVAECILLKRAIERAISMASK